MYDIKAKLRTGDYWFLSMYNTYHSLVGVVNLVFFMSMIILCWRFFYKLNYFLQTVLFLLLIWFPVLNPLIVYFKSKIQVSIYPKDGLNISFSNKGMSVSLNEKKQTFHYNELKIQDTAGMLIFQTRDQRGYIITKASLRDSHVKREELVSYLKSMKERFG